MYIFVGTYLFAHNASGFRKIHRFFIAVFRVSFLQRVGKIFLEGQKDITSLFVFFEGSVEFGKECGLLNGV